MNKRTKWIPLVLAGLLVGGFVGCNGKEPESTNVSWTQTLSQDSVPTYTYQAPKSVQTQWKDQTGKLLVNVDAKIVYPGEQKYAVAALSPVTVDQSIMERVQAAVVPKGVALYKTDTLPEQEKNAYYPTVPKADMEVWIGEVESLLSEDSPLKDLQQTDPGRYQEIRSMLETSLEQWKGWISDVPEGYCETKVEALAPISELNSQTGGSVSYLIEAGKPVHAQLNVLCDEKGKSYTLSYHNEGLRQYEGLGYLYNEYGFESNDQHADLSGSELGYQQAYEQAESLVKTLGVADRMTLSRAWQGQSTRSGLSPRPCYYFCFTNAYQGLVDQKVFWAQQALFPSGSQTGTQQEIIAIGIDDEGLVSLDWRFPYSVEIVKDNVQLMDFESLMNQCQQEIDALANQLGSTKTDGSIQSDVLQVTSIELAYCVLEDQGCLYLVPVWNFYGKWIRAYTDTNVSVDPERTNENNELTYEGTDCCLFSVNAIDGSWVMRPNL